MTAVARMAGFVTAAAVLIVCGWMGRQADAADSGSQALGQAATLAAACTGCHLEGGGAIASLDTRDADDIHASLVAYKADPGGASVMHRIARGYSEAEMRMIAAYLAARDGR